MYRIYAPVICCSLLHNVLFILFWLLLYIAYQSKICIVMLPMATSTSAVIETEEFAVDTVTFFSLFTVVGKLEDRH